LELELNDQEGRALGRSLVERKARLIEKAEDTTQPPAARRSGSLELKAIASALRKLQSVDRRDRQRSPSLNSPDGCMGVQ